MAEDASTNANPLLLGWVKEWYDTARQQNSKGVTTYRHAYESLRACPIVFDHPSQLQQLKGFGPKLSDRLTEKLKKHCLENGLPMPEPPGSRRRGNHDAQDQTHGESVSGQTKKPRKTKAYVPAYRSGAYALLLALSAVDETSTAGLTKAELTETAQPHCDSSFSAPSDPTKFYTAWNSMKTLLQKELVFERGRPLKRYALTDEGWEVARRIKESITTEGDGIRGQQIRRPGGSAAPPRVSGSTSGVSNGHGLDTDIPSASQAEFRDVVSEDSNFTEASTLPRFTAIQLPPGSFSVHLILDVREVRAKTDRDYLQEELAKKGVKPVMRSLDLGDALWVAKCNDPGFLARHGAEGDEVVLDYIVERKRLDDLIGSIKDGRFHEQKFRLRRSGIQNVVYIIEDITLDSGYFQKFEEAVQSAIASTQVVNGYFLKRTQKMDDTIRYLAKMTMMLKKLYEGKSLHVIPTKIITAQNYVPLIQHIRETQPSTPHYISYPAFASLASKSDMMTLRDVFLKMLMCTRGVTGEKAIEIQRRWKTPYDLVNAFERCGSGDEGKKRKRDMVANETCHLMGRKKIAKTVSQKIAEVWGDA
jgi:crossover junction endonuclease MUS81